MRTATVELLILLHQILLWKVFGTSVGGANATHLIECGFTGGPEAPILIATRTFHPFHMAVLPRKVDRAVSRELEEGGMFDAQVLGPMQFILQTHPCDATSLVVDAGANVGFFGFFALSMHCPVVFFEPQTKAGAAINSSLCINKHFRRHADFFNMPISTSPTVSFPVSFKEVDNTGSIGIAMCDKLPPQDCETRRTVQLDGIFTSLPRQHTGRATRVRVLKLDTEGFESDVLLSGEKLLSRRLVDNILVEVTPHTRGVNATMHMLKSLVRHGYSFAQSPFYSWRTLLNASHPYTRPVIPLGKNLTVLQGIVDYCMDQLKVPKWKGIVQTDLWAALDETQFQNYNALVEIEKSLGAARLAHRL